MLPDTKIEQKLLLFSLVFISDFLLLAKMSPGRRKPFQGRYGLRSVRSKVALLDGGADIGLSLAAACFRRSRQGEIRLKLRLLGRG